MDRNNRRRTLAFIAVVASVVSSAGLLFAPAASAAVNCTVAGNYHVGYYQSGHPEYPFEGVRADIVVRQGQNCSGAPGLDRFVNQYVMIAGSANGWGQLGFEKSEGKNLRWFSQFYDGSGTDYDTRYSTFTVESEIGVSHAFRVLWSYSAGALKATIDTTTWDVSAFNPFVTSAWGSQPWSPQFTGETGYTASYVPGSASAKTHYYNMGAQRADSDAIIAMPCILSSVSDSSLWHHAATACDDVNIWTE